MYLSVETALILIPCQKLVIRAYYNNKIPNSNKVSKCSFSFTRTKASMSFRLRIPALLPSFMSVTPTELLNSLFLITAVLCVLRVMKLLPVTASCYFHTFLN